MKLLVIGATRGIGRRLVELALEESHTVTALVRDPGRLPVSHDHRVLVDLEGVVAGKISRADVAHFILSEIKDKAYRLKTPLLTY
jgi:putative NADH-flavin reductase